MANGLIEDERLETEVYDGLRYRLPTKQIIIINWQHSTLYPKGRLLPSQRPSFRRQKVAF